MKKRTIRNWGIALILLLLSGIVMLTASAVSNTPQAVDVTLNEKLATSAPTNEISEEELMNIIESQLPMKSFKKILCGIMNWEIICTHTHLLGHIWTRKPFNCVSL